MALTSFKVDQAGSFKAVHLVSVAPKMAFGKDEQDKTKDGIPVWTADVMVSAEQFGRETNEVVKVTVVSPKDPSEGIPMFTPVVLHGLTVNVFDASRKDRDTGQREVTGAGVSIRCDRIEAAVRQMKAAS
jgi:hypothetical protein